MGEAATGRIIRRVLASGLAAALLGGMATLVGVGPAAAAGLASSFNVVTIAGTGVAGGTGATGPASDAELANPTAVAVDTTSGNPDYDDVAIAGTVDDFGVRVIAGSTGTQFGRHMTKGDIYTIRSNIQSAGVAFNKTGDLLFTNPGNGTVGIAQVGTGVVSTDLVGYPSNTLPTAPFVTTTPATTARIYPIEVAVTPTTGNVLFTDQGGPGDLPGVRYLAETTGTYFGKSVTKGDVYTLTSSSMYTSIQGIAVDPTNGNVVFGLQSGGKGDVVELDAPVTGTYYGVGATAYTPVLIAGTPGTANSGSVASSTQDAASAKTTATLNSPDGLFIDSAHNLLIADSGDHAVRAVAAATTASASLYGVSPAGGTVAGDIYTLAGTGGSGAPTQYVAATSSDFGTLSGVAITPATGHPIFSDVSHGEVDEIGPPTGAAPTAAPVGLKVTPSGGGAALATWQPVPVTTEGFTAPTTYTLTWYICTSVSTCSPAGSVTVTASAVSVTVHDLTAGDLYKFTVTGSNGAGAGPASTPVYATGGAATIPGPVTDLTETSSHGPGATGQIKVTWSAPASDGGSPITGYTATISPCSSSCTLNAPANDPTATFTTLTNGVTYTVAVAAKNAVGTGTSTSITGEPTGVPGGPVITSATPGNDSVTLDWSAPVTDGGSPITDYDVVVDVNGTFTHLTHSTGTSYTVTGLTNGTTYAFQVGAVNVNGTGPLSTPVHVTPVSMPSAPTNVVATAGLTAGHTSKIHVTWTASAANGTTISGYSLTATPVGGGPTVTAEGSVSGSGTIITGLTKGTTYDVTVAAIYGPGVKNGPASSPPVTVTTDNVPGAPSDVVATSATNGSGDITLTWGAPTDHGATVKHDTITVRNATGTPLFTTTTVGAATSYVVTGAALLTPGDTYTFTVSATNTVGQGSTSAPSNQATSITAPTAPTVSGTDAATANTDGTVTLTWSAPATHGATITKYTVTPSTSCTKCTGLLVTGTPPVTSTTISGLTPGTSYTFIVTATNAVGTSATSGTSNAVTPKTAPDAPTGVTAASSATGTKIHVTFTHPASANGTTITGYDLVATPTAGGAPTIAPVGSSATTGTITSLAKGTTYDVTVVATFTTGKVGPASSPPVVVTTDNVPGAPSDVEAASLLNGSGDIALTWAAPAGNGSAITGYTVTVSPSCTVACTGTSVSGTSATIGGLTPGITYTFTVKATNTAGTGATSGKSNQATSMTKPSTPAAPTATANANGTVTLEWTAPDANGATITSYTVTPSTACPTCTGLVVRGDPAGTTTTITGLTLGQSYTFKVTATNEVDPSTPSLASNPAVIPATVPAAPTGVTATAELTGTNPKVHVTWTAPSDNGSTLTHYTLSATPIGGGTPVTATITAPAATGNITGLTAGITYDVTVTATNGIGAGPASSPPAVVTTDAVPGAPTSVVAASALTGTGNISLTWSAPPANGSAITDYHVTATVVGGLSLTPFNVGSAATSYTVLGTSLTAGDTYTFTVNATNGVGAGLTSAPSNQATSITKPAKPTTPVATANANGTVTLTWAPATATDGATITSYTVTPSTACPTCTGLVVRGDPAGTTTTITGLTLGTAYHFTVKATNEVGSSVTSTTSNTVTPATVPAAPTGVTATAALTAATPKAPQIDVTWTAPGDNGSALTGYTLSATPIGGGTTVTGTAAHTATSGTITTGLAAGITYDVTVTATNGIGAGPASSPPAVVTTDAVPGAPGSVVATALVDGSATVTWMAPATHGTPITSYTVTSTPACPGCKGLTVSGSPAATSTAVTGLTVGTSYTFTVTATNTVGTGAASAPSNQVGAAGLPAAPANVTAQPGNGQVTVTWSSPFANFNPITAYTVTAVPTGCSGTCPATVVVKVTGNPPSTTATVSGLQNHLTYDVTVTATNAAGTGPASSPAAVVVPAPEQGYWISTAQGAVYSYGGAHYYGAAGQYHLNQPIVAMAATPDHQGYWQVAGDGGIFAFGDAGFYGSTGSMTLNQPVVGMAPTANGQGYWEVAADGGVFAYGNAAYHGSLPGLNVDVDDIVGIVPTANGGGYWMVGADGGVFAFGNAGYYGSLPGDNVHVDDIVGFVPSNDGAGYWMVGADGGVFAFGDAGFHGSLGGTSLGSPIAGLAVTPSGNGYWLAAQDGYVFTEGDAMNEGSPGGSLDDGQTVVSIVSSD